MIRWWVCPQCEKQGLKPRPDHDYYPLTHDRKPISSPKKSKGIA